jgi:hypothetical protein
MWVLKTSLLGDFAWKTSQSGVDIPMAKSNRDPSSTAAESDNTILNQ